MASQNNNNEFQKMSKKLFAPPLRKPNTAFAKGDPALQRKQEVGQAIPAPSLNHSGANGSAAKPMKAHPPKANLKGQEKRQEGLSSTKGEKGARRHKEEGPGIPPKNVMAKEDDCLNDSVFEEIVENVLKKPLKELTEDFKKVATSAEEQSLGRATVEASLPTKKALSGKASRGGGEVMLLKAGQQEPQPEKRRRHGELPVKDENEDPEADNGGRKENRKGAPKKKVQGNAQIVHREEKQKEGEVEEKAADEGSCSWCVAWAQCSYPACGKWRRLSSNIDPSVLPENWSCSQSPDPQYNSCSIPEETWSGSESEVVYAVYIPGSIVWAKQYGYPWWPGMIEADPDIGEYFLFSSRTNSLPSKYHVTFFGDSVSRAWISASMLRNFGEPNAEDNCLAKPKIKGDRKNLERAQKMAKEAEQMSIPERIRMFGFCSRFREKKDGKDLDSLTSHPHAKKTEDPGGRKASPGTSAKNQYQRLLGTPVVKPDGKLKSKKACVKRVEDRWCPPKAVAESKAKEPQDGLKGPHVSFAVPRSTDAEAKQPGPYTDSSSSSSSSTAHLLPSGHPSEKTSSNKAETSQVAENNLFLNKDTVVTHEEPDKLKPFGCEKEGTFSSQEITVFAEEKNHTPEDFSLALFEE